MKRIATVLTPVTLLALLALGAAPSGQKANDAEVPSVVQPTVTAAAPVSEPAPAEPRLTEPVLEAPESQLQPEAAGAQATYEIDWYSVNGGGTVNATSTNYRMGASIGQSVAGAASSASYNMGIGFWYGAGGSGSCACDCHADPSPIGACDGIQNVTDVVQCVNVAFRNAAAILDPNGNCPYETTDVNCDLFTTILDVVRMVNVAFRNGNPAVEFCNPCP
jgi:hypothetical protein